MEDLRLVNLAMEEDKKCSKLVSRHCRQVLELSLS